MPGKLADRIRAWLDDLPARQREVVLLRDVEGMTSDEVCAVLELSEGNQRVLLHRGRSSSGSCSKTSSGRHDEASRIRELGSRDLVCQQAVELVTDYLEGTLTPDGPPPVRGAPGRLPALHRVPGPDARDDQPGRPDRTRGPDPARCETSSWTCSGAGSPNSSEHGRQPQGAGQRQQDHGGQLVAPGELERVRADQQHDRRQRHHRSWPRPSRRASRRTSPASDPATPATSAAACSGPGVYPPSSW